MQRVLILLLQYGVLSTSQSKSSPFLNYDSEQSTPMQVSQAQEYIQALKELTTVMQVNGALSTGQQVFEAINYFSRISNLAPVAGLVYSLLQDYSQQEEDFLMRQLNSVYQQILNVSEPMDNYFFQLFVAEQGLCAVKYGDANLILVTAMQSLQEMYGLRGTNDYDQAVDNFLQSCHNQQCQHAIEILLSGLNNDKRAFDCDIMQLMYEPSSTNQYTKAWLDQMASKSAYLYSLLSQGIVIMSAYVSLDYNSTLAYRDVQQKYEDMYRAAYQRIAYFLWACDHYIGSNAWATIDGHIQYYKKPIQYSGKNTLEASSEDIAKLLIYKYPQFKWNVITSFGNFFDHFSYTCVGCFSYGVHYNTYILIGYAYNNYNITINTQSSIDWYASLEGNTQQQILDQVIESACYQGVFVLSAACSIKKYSGNFDQNAYASFGSYNSIFVWKNPNQDCLYGHRQQPGVDPQF